MRGDVPVALLLLVTEDTASPRKDDTDDTAVGATNPKVMVERMLGRSASKEGQTICKLTSEDGAVEEEVAR